MLTRVLFASESIHGPTMPQVSQFRRRVAGPVLLFLSLAAAAMGQLPARGRMLPDVPIQLGDASLDLKQYRGKAMVIGLISTTCAHCEDAMKALNQVQAKYGRDRLQVVVAAGDPVAKTAINEYAARLRANFPVGALDQAPFMKLADIKPGVRPFVPIVMFVDAKGMVRAQYFGDDGAMKQDAAGIIKLTADQLMKSVAPPKKAAPSAPKEQAPAAPKDEAL